MGEGGGQKKNFCPPVGGGVGGWERGGGAEKRISVHRLMSVWAYKEGMVEKKKEKKAMLQGGEPWSVRSGITMINRGKGNIMTGPNVPRPAVGVIP